MAPDVQNIADGIYHEIFYNRCVDVNVYGDPLPECINKQVVSTFVLTRIINIIIINKLTI